MKDWIKIILILLAIFPLWVTIAAMGAEPVEISDWKSALNSRLLEQATATRRIQIEDLQTRNADWSKISPVSNAFEISFIDERAQGLSSIEVRFADSQGRLRSTLKGSVRLRIEQYVAVAARELTRGWVISSEDVRMDWVNEAQLNSRPVESKLAWGKKVKLPIKAGAPVLSGQLEIESLVKTGERVRVTVKGQGVMVVGTGIAKEEGRQGQTIRVLNPESRREIYGTVVGLQLVEVRL